jgi:hypothetical protein
MTSSAPTPDVFHGYTIREVSGERVATPEQLAKALRINPLRLRHRPGFRNGEKVTCMDLEWPLWLKGTLTEGKVVVGDTPYQAPCALHFPAMQNIEIVEPITFTGKLRVKPL